MSCISCVCSRPLLYSAAVAVLVACGGGGDATAPSSAAEGATKKKAAAFVPSTPIPADANVKGMYSPVYGWPLIPLHAVLLPDGRVLTYGSNGDGAYQTGKFIYDIWDPQGGLAAGHLTLPNTTPTDTFCSTQLVLPQSGTVFIGGGDNWNTTVANATNNQGNNNSNLFTPADNALTPANNMNRARWYATSTTLVNGETLVAGGSGGQDAWEIRGLDGSFRLLGADTGWIDWYYPRNFVRPDGKVIGVSSNGYVYKLDTSAASSALWLADLPAPFVGTNPSAVDSTIVMYRPGKLIQFGGESNGALLIDISTTEVGISAPAITTTAPLSSQRRLVTGTLLADGKLLATGGSTVYNTMTGVNYNAEIWNPATGLWTVGAAATKARLYHSMALLLPDATVMVGGGGVPGPQINTNFELYFPPYLFGPNGTLAARPTITAAPTVLDIGKTFQVQVAAGDAVSRVVLVKTGSVTHANNMDQRFVELPFAANGSTLAVQAPSRAGEATPGFYMLFVLNAAGVPSVSKILRMNIAAVPNPATVPTFTNPGNQASAAGAAINLQLNASDPNGDVLGYGASNLPPGLSLNASTGAITGSPTTAGTYAVVAAASDGVNTATVTFSWVVTGAPALVLSVPTPPVARQAGSVASFTASTSNATNPRYKWDFGDGTPETAYASAPTATHTYAQPGRYLVTVTATDDRNVEQRLVLVQAIYLPATAQRPAASSNLVLQQPATGNARLWVVNQDNDTVSVFDAVTRAKLAEIAVGAAPRTLAVAPTGMVWVTNRQGASISVIDGTSFAINRTLALPRGALPYGIAMAPAGGYALVVLEATGQVLKFDTTSYAQIGAALSVGTSPRQVSINAAGTLAYVSRFITRPLPGEATAVVNTTGAGGEVLTIDTATMALASTVVLAHSEQPDAENQGRGVPNYLGAAAISPDGTQAFVPSKQDNIQRGTLRDGRALDFQNTVRAISSRIDLASGLEDLVHRIDHDNASLASAAAYEPRGNYLFVALETSAQVAVIDAFARTQLFRINTGIAPQGLVVADDGKTLYVSNFMSRSVSVFDLTALMAQGQAVVPLLATLPSVATEKLGAMVLAGKQLFYNAADARLARDSYMSCASCHNDGGGDGRVWDFTSLGEGLRNTIALRGRAGMAQGLLHWSGNFDEVQDFEGQIRNLSGGTGLMTDAQFNTGTRSQPLGNAKAGVSADLDALAAYVASLNQFDLSPLRNADGSLTASAMAGATVFTQRCVACHSGTGFTDSVTRNIGTVKQPTSGNRLGAALTGIDTPTLRDVWATAPYLHDGSAASIEAAVQAHNGFTLVAADLASVSAYVRQIGREEAGSVAGGVRYVRLVALTEVSGSPVIAMAEFNLLDAAGATLSRSGWVASADSAETDGPVANAIDGLNSSIWHTQWRSVLPAPPHTYTVDLGASVPIGGFRYLPRQDGASIGRIASWRFESSADKLTWSVVAQGSFANSATEKTVMFAAPANTAPTLATVAGQAGVVGTAGTLTLVASDADGDALSYTATGLPPGLALNAGTGVISGTPTTAGSYAVSATVSDGRGGTATQGFTWAVTATLPPGAVRYVRLVALSEVSGNPVIAMAEFNVLNTAGTALSRSGWVASADSAETDGPVANAIDGLSSSIWHTQWRSVLPAPPHTYTVDLGASVQIGGFRYLPRQDGASIGRIATWRFETSPDNLVWSVLTQGSFANTAAEKTVTTP